MRQKVERGQLVLGQKKLSVFSPAITFTWEHRGQCQVVDLRHLFSWALWTSDISNNFFMFQYTCTFPGQTFSTPSSLLNALIRSHYTSVKIFPIAFRCLKTLRYPHSSVYAHLFPMKVLKLVTITPDTEVKTEESSLFIQSGCPPYIENQPKYLGHGTDCFLRNGRLGIILFQPLHFTNEEIGTLRTTLIS